MKCFVVTVSLSLFFFLTGCDSVPWGFTTIGEIIKSPANFEGKELKVKGTITDATKIPFTDLRFYTLNDGTGIITVLAKLDLPALNGKIQIKGKVESSLVLAGHSLGTHITEEKRL